MSEKKKKKELETRLRFKWNVSNCLPRPISIFANAFRGKESKTLKNCDLFLFYFELNKIKINKKIERGKNTLSGSTFKSSGFAFGL